MSGSGCKHKFKVSVMKQTQRRPHPPHGHLTELGNTGLSFPRGKNSGVLRKSSSNLDFL